jgi:hypothetical protein
MPTEEHVAQNVAVAGESAGELWADGVACGNSSLLEASRRVLEDFRSSFGDRKGAKMFSANLEDRKQMVEHLMQYKEQGLREAGADDETIRLWSRELRRKSESLDALIRYHLLGASDACSWLTHARAEAPRLGRPRARQRRRVNARRGPPSREPDEPHDLVGRQGVAAVTRAESRRV